MGKQYEVVTFEVAKVTYHVKADSYEDAIRLAGSPDSIQVNVEMTDSFVDERGLSFETAEEQGINTDTIRQEFNNDRNDEYIEGICSIREI